MSQTSYSNTFSEGIAGMLYDLRAHEVITRINDDGTDIPFGVAVARKADGTIKLPTLTGDLILGVAVFDQSRENRALASDAAIADGSPMNVLRKGVVWVEVEDACTEGGVVYVRHAGSGDKGAFKGSDDSTNASLLAGARWLSTQASAGGLALLEIDLAGGGAMS